MIILEGLYWFLANIWMYTGILLLSIFLNFYYFLKFYKHWHNTKKLLKKEVNNCYSYQDCMNLLYKIIPEYGYDPLKGTLNWFASVLTTYNRTLYDSEQKHSKDCREHSAVLKYILENSPYGKSKYEKVKIYTYLSLKPFIKMNHMIVHAYHYDKRGFIDVYTPYKFWGTFQNEDKIYKEVSSMLNYSSDSIIYSRLIILNLF